MKSDINLQSIALKALNAFPPMGSDNSAASDYAQKMLTKILSQKRKQGDNLTEEEVRTLRATLGVTINITQVPSRPVGTPEAGKHIPLALKHPQINDLEPIISDCFHTATDGSPQHLKYLGDRAMKRVMDYLGSTNVGWFERMRLKSRTKKLIQKHIKKTKSTPSK